MFPQLLPIPALLLIGILLSGLTTQSHCKKTKAHGSASHALRAAESKHGVTSGDVCDQHFTMREDAVKKANPLTQDVFFTNPYFRCLDCINDVDEHIKTSSKSCWSCWTPKRCKYCHYNNNEQDENDAAPHSHLLKKSGCALTSSRCPAPPEADPEAVQAEGDDDSANSIDGCIAAIPLMNTKDLRELSKVFVPTLHERQRLPLDKADLAQILQKRATKNADPRPSDEIMTLGEKARKGKEQAYADLARDDPAAAEPLAPRSQQLGYDQQATQCVDDPLPHRIRRSTEYISSTHDVYESVSLPERMRKPSSPMTSEKARKASEPGTAFCGGSCLSCPHSWINLKYDCFNLAEHGLEGEEEAVGCNINQYKEPGWNFQGSRLVDHARVYSVPTSELPERVQLHVPGCAKPPTQSSEESDVRHSNDFPIPDYCSRAIVQLLSAVYTPDRRRDVIFEQLVNHRRESGFEPPSFDSSQRAPNLKSFWRDSLSSWSPTCSGTYETFEEVMRCVEPGAEPKERACWGFNTDFKALYCSHFQQCAEKPWTCCQHAYKEVLRQIDNLGVERDRCIPPRKSSSTRDEAEKDAEKVEAGAHMHATTGKHRSGKYGRIPEGELGDDSPQGRCATC